ncbi:type I-U CRISPR-associated protein Cas5/Cas6, partial [bacterium]|nr:type I-U CRISPR-associated protein Cas5/Cas6 [bacterium]
VLCPNPVDAFDDTHVTKDETIGRGKNKQTVKVSRYSPAWHLCIDTAQLHQEKWSDPPGSQWVSYVRPADCFDPPPRMHLKPYRREALMHVVRFALDSTVLPLITETLPIAESFRRAVHYHCTMLAGRERYGKEHWSWQKHKDGEQPVDLSPFQNLTGKDANQNPLDGHGHAYYLPTDEDGDGRLDHLMVVSLNGFNRKELHALDRLRHIRRSEDMPELRLLMTGYGPIEDFQPFPIKSARQWVSATPFIVTRHLKKRGQKRDPKELFSNPQLFVKTVLQEELARFLQRQPVTYNWEVDQINIEYMTDENGVFHISSQYWIPQSSGQHWRPIQFKRYRKKFNDDGGRRQSGCFVITFPEPVTGPIALGHSSHFGMGLFLPADESN